MVQRSIVLILSGLLYSCIVSVHTVDASIVSPDAQLMMKEVQSYLDSKAGFGDAAFVRRIHTTLEKKAKEKEVHPYAKHLLHQMKKGMEERYTYIGAKENTLGETKQVIENGKKKKRKQVADVSRKKEHAVAVVSSKRLGKKKEEQEKREQEDKEEVDKEEVDEVDKEEEKHVKKTESQTSSEEAQKHQEELVFTTASINKHIQGDQRYALGNGRINTSQLRRTWIGRVNDFRKKEGVEKKIVHQAMLDKTATEHSYYQRSIGTWTHRRTPHSAFYDYDEITRWFNDRGVDFKNVNRATHTENVGLSTLYCDGGDCTQEAETSLSWVFDYFIKEKGTNYTAHYDTIVQPYFGEMGFGIAIDEKTDTIYSTMHYATEAIRKPVQVVSR